MAALGKIRKQGIALICIIGLGLFAFIAEEMFRSCEASRNNQRQQVGEVLGEKINVQEFQKLVDEYTEVIKMQQRNFDFLYFITTLQAEFDYIPVNRKLIPVEGDMFKRDMYLTYLRNNEGKVAPFLEWVNSRLISRDGSAVGVFADE